MEVRGCPGGARGWPYRVHGGREQVREGRAPGAPVATAATRRRAGGGQDGSRWEVEDGPGWLGRGGPRLGRGLAFFLFDLFSV